MNVETDRDVPVVFDPPYDVDTVRGAAREAQRAVVEAEVVGGEPLWVEACPGAGKTRVVVDRHLERSGGRPLGPRKGRAIVSFTRVAGRELKRRCEEAGRPELVSLPHFIGTLDSFIWLHLVRPYLAALGMPNRRWWRLDGWHAHPGARERGLSLDDFDFAEKDGLRIGSAVRRSARHNAGTGDPRRDAQWAQKMHNQLFDEGFFTGELLRDIALKLLGRQEWARLILGVVVSRFGELIVDEAQDCSKEDKRILQLLNQHGLPVLLVGDPGQAIYGFRDREDARGVFATSSHATTMRLNYNWRSTQNICEAAATLRTGGQPADVAAGDHRAEQIPILLVPRARRGAAHVQAFAAEAERLRIPRAERIVVSSIGSALPAELAGKPRPPTSLLGRMVWAVGLLRASRAPEKRVEQAHRIVRENMLDLWCGERDLTVEQRLERLGLAKDGLLRAEARVVDELPPLDTSTAEWTSVAKQVLRKHRPSPMLEKPPGKLSWRIPPGQHNKPVYSVGKLKGSEAAQSAEVGQLSTIHQVKGEEADAVLVIVPAAGPHIPEPLIEAFDSWLAQRRPANREAIEARNALYVAATRARNLLAFAVDAERIDRTRDVLESCGVPTRIDP